MQNIKLNLNENNSPQNRNFDCHAIAAGFRKAGLISVWLGLLVALTSSAYFSSNAPDSSEKTAKVSFYIRTGQWLADARTIVNVFRFLMDLEEDCPDPPNWLAVQSASTTTSANASPPLKTGRASH